MAAIAYPSPEPAHRQRPVVRPRHLTVVGPRPSAARRAAVYRRRRLVALVVVVTLAAMLALAVVGARTLLAAPDGGVPAPASRSEGPTRIHVVRPGDTLWTVARSLNPDGDVRATVDRLAAAHGAGPLRVGERLQLDG
jgi:hypothetical protein